MTYPRFSRDATGFSFRSGILSMTLTTLLTVAALGASSSASADGGAKVHQQQAAVARSEEIMAEAQTRKGMLAQYVFMRDSYASSTDASFRVIFNQYLSWYQTWVGDYVGARNSFSILQKAERDDAASPLDGNDWHSESAVSAITRLAKDEKAVFFNENHSYPLTRTLTVKMLAALRKEGFDTFAAETLNQPDMVELPKRGYVIHDTGFYTEEPIYAEMVNAALKLGYRVVAYEALSDATGDAREEEQARNLKRDVYKDHPDARLVVNAGFAHIQEHGKYLGGSAMAQHFKSLTRINPLTIEQTMLVPHDKVSSNHPFYNEVMQKLTPRQPIVFVDKKGQPWSLKEKAYDVSVFFPEEVLQRGRPTWLSLVDMREPFEVSGRMCDQKYPCMVEARYPGQPDEAIPADRVVINFKSLLAGYDDKVRQSSDPYPVAELWLRPGRYEILSRDMTNQPRHRQTIEVGSVKPAP